VLPATVSVQSRGVPVMFALAVMVICPLPVPFVGETVSQSAQGLNEFQLQFEPVATVTFTLALPPLGPSATVLVEAKKEQAVVGVHTTWSTQPRSCPLEPLMSFVYRQRKTFEPVAML